MDTDINYIIQESINGDKYYEEILLKKLHPLIYKNIYRYYDVHDSIVEDLVQEGYIVILKSLKSFNEERNVHFLNYVKTKIFYFYKNYYRNTKKERKTISLNQKLENTDNSNELENLIKGSSISPEDAIIKKEELHEMNKNIKKLSKKEIDVLNMYYYDKFSMHEISENLNIAYRTAIGRKYTALCKLKKMMGVTDCGGEKDG